MSRRTFLVSAASAGMSAALLGCSATAPIFRAREPFDILLAGGTVLDGTGAPPVAADIGIRDGVITAVGNLTDTRAARVVDARGLHVTPGFIDIHSHVDLELLRDPRAESKVRQGVTTEVTGMDGDSEAPLGGPAIERRLASFREVYGFECPYRDMDGFLSLLERNRSAQNICTFVGLGTVREMVVGLDNRPATPDEKRAMQREVLEAIEQGAMGTSTGLEYTPGSFASTEELWEIVRVAPERFRIYATHMRNEDNRVLEAIEEAITIARNAGARLQVSHLKAQNRINWHKQAEALRLLEQAIEAGIDTHADRYPYVAFNTGLTSLFPLWSRDGGTEMFLSRLRDPDTLARIRTDVLKKVEGLGSWDAVLISSVRLEQNKKYQGKTLRQIAADDNVDPFEFTVALMLEEEARVGMVGFGMDEAGTEMVLAWKNTMVASDAGANSPSRPETTPHPRSYGTFPRAIAHYQRERKITSLPDMIRKMTSLPAAKLGLDDRGTIARGKAADLVLFDYEAIRDRATFLNPHQFPEGIPHVIVNGVVVVDGDSQTEALPGRVLRSA